MDPDGDADTGVLIERVAAGDQGASEQLLAKHRDRLRRMLAVRMDRRLVARLDPSDIIQEALVEASQRLSEYVRERPIPFYPWLRRIAWERLVEVHRYHVRAKKRSVIREEEELSLPEGSVVALADRLAAHQSSPSAGLVRREMADRLRTALEDLAADDREILVLRHLEQLSAEETAAVMGLSPAAAKSRHFRAIQRLHLRLTADGAGDGP